MNIKYASNHIHRNMINRQAFTLLELVLTLAILITIAGVVTTALSSYLWQIEKGKTVSRIRLSLLNARQHAIDSGRHTVWAVPQSNELQPGAHIECSSHDIRFLPDGTATDAQICILNDHIAIATVRVVGATGAVLIDKGPNL